MAAPAAQRQRTQPASDELHVIFGASGALGNTLIRELAANSRRVRAVNRSGSADVPEGVEVVAGDASDPMSARDVCRGATVVYNCANAPYHRWPEEFPPIMDGIIAGAASAGAKLVFADNLYMYGPVNAPMIEEMAYAAETRKGRVRAQMATALMIAHASGRVRGTIARASDFFGPGVTLSALADRVFPAALAGKSAQVTGDIDAAHTYTYIRDFARALVTLGERDEALGEVWHVPNAEPVTTRQLLEMIYDQAGAEPKIMAAGRWLITLMSPFNAGMREMREMLYQFEQPFVVDHGKFERAFGANPTPLRDAIGETLNWYRQRAG